MTPGPRSNEYRYSVFSAALEVVLTIAYREAVSRRHAYLTLEHLLFALAHDTEGERIMMKKLGHPADFLDREGKRFPIGRLMKPSEIAEVALFLASPKGMPFSGQVIDLEQFPIGCLFHPKDTEPLQ